MLKRRPIASITAIPQRTIVVSTDDYPTDIHNLDVLTPTLGFAVLVAIETVDGKDFVTDLDVVATIVV